MPEYQVNGKEKNGVPLDTVDVGYNNKAYKNTELEDEKENGSSSSSDEKEKDEKAELQAVSIGELFRYATSLDWLLMFIATIAAIGNGVAQPVSFILFGEIINDFINVESDKPLDIEGAMQEFALYYVYVAIATIVLGYLQNTLWLFASIRQAFVIRTQCFKSILRQDIGWFDTTDSGELSTRLADDITKIQNGIGDKIGSLQQAIAMLVAGMAIGFGYGWQLTLVIMAMSPLLIFAAYITGKVIAMITSEEQTAYAKAGSIAEEVLSSIRTVVAFGGEEKEIGRYKSKLLEAEKAGIKKGISSGFAFALFNSVIFGLCAVAFWYGGELVVDGKLSGGDLLIVFFSVLIGAAQVGQVGPNVEAFMVARGAAYYIYNLMDRCPVIDSFSEEGSKPKISGDISFINCKFNYPSRPDIKILQNLDLHIPTGTTCALVGESGCGKSTTVKLVQRFYDVHDGSVLIDNNNIKDINVRYLRKHIGVVSQEPVLFDASIADNIRMGHSDATQEMIETAAKNANAYDFITALPNGFDTYVGEGGAQLSGGQKQRIAIARALVRDPKILLLDEATSALDTESESVVQAALEKASEGRTTIIIAHRLSTIRKATMIAVVAAGQIVEIGKHEELMAKRGEYFKLVMLQTMQEEEEENNENKDLASILSDSEREELLARKMLRSISQISDGSEQEISKELERKLSRKASRKPALEKQKSVKEEEIEEEQPSQVPSMWRIMKMNLKEWPFMLVGVIFAAVAGAMPVAFAIILSEVLESFTLAHQPKKMQHDSEFWSIMFMVLGFAIGIGYFIAQYMFAIAGEALTTRLREMAFRALLRQEIGYFDVPLHSTGALTARLASDASAVQGATSTRLNTLTQVLVMGLSSLIIAFVYSWQLSLVILAFVPLIAFAGAVQTKLNTSFAADSQKLLSEAGSLATEAIMQIRTVASLGKEDYFYNKYIHLILGPNKKSRKSAHFFGLSFGFSMGIIFFSNAAAFYMGGYLHARGEVTMSDMIKVMMSIQFGAMTAGQLASFAPDYVKAKVAAGRILDLFDRVPAIDSYSKEGIKDEISGNVEFSDVKFHYPNRANVPVLQGLNVKIQQGQMVAFVGASGCGKSTSVSLLERFYDVAGGAVFIDGKPIKDYNIRQLRAQIGIVQQEPVLFERSIRDNILYGINEHERKVEQAELEDACKSSNIHHFVSNLPNGYGTNVGDKGALISGGQKQRIAIARALIRNPKILLLDEATSALDSESEKIVQEALDVAMEGRTAIVIAHRLSTIQNADVIAVMQGGKIVELGNHHELLALKGAYYLLNQAQL